MNKKLKKNVMTLTFLSLVLFITKPAYAFKFVVYTDETSTNKAKEVGEVMKSTYPFNKFDIEVEIVRVPPADLECGSERGIDRMVTCKNSGDFLAKAKELGGDQAMIVKDMSKWGGSAVVGDGVPIITTGTTARAMIHEFLHTLGMCDEYEYEASEAAASCGSEKDTPNVIFITPLSGYSGDSHARSVHGAQIPWFNDILATTPITHSLGARLGTGDVDFTQIAPPNNTKELQTLGELTGLYQGKVCNKANPPRASWQPGGGATVMENMEAGLGAPLEKIVERIMASKGVRKKMQLEEPKEAPQVDPPAGKVLVTPVADVGVNDSSRSFFKSFMNWLKDIFETIRNGFPR